MCFSNRLFLKLCSFSVVEVVPLYPFGRVRFSVSITEKKVRFYPLLYPLYLYNVKPSFHQSSIVGMLTPFLCRKTLTKE